jgi:AcrR family transcriptional regulator
LRAETLTKGQATRQKILDIAEASVLSKGFGATSIDEIIAEASITKGGFYYHFADKNELAREMLIRYMETSDQVFDEVFGRGRALSDDPLQAFLIGLNLFAEVLEDLPNGHPGCLVAAICYQERLFDRGVVALNVQGVEDWHRRFRGYLDEIAEVHPPRHPIDFDDVADMLSCIVDGGIILTKISKDPGRLPRQVRAYRSFVKLLFS